MYTAVQPKLKSALDGFQPATCCTLATATTAAAGAARQQHKGAMSAAHVAAGLELCRLSKLLLVAGEAATDGYSCSTVHITGIRCGEQGPNLRHSPASQAR
jgi:hypothetical protein